MVLVIGYLRVEKMFLRIFNILSDMMAANSKVEKHRVVEGIYKAFVMGMSVVAGSSITSGSGT